MLREGTSRTGEPGRLPSVNQKPFHMDRPKVGTVSRGLMARMARGEEAAFTPPGRH